MPTDQAIGRVGAMALLRWSPKGSGVARYADCGSHAKSKKERRTPLRLSLTVSHKIQLRAGNSLQRDVTAVAIPFEDTLRAMQRDTLQRGRWIVALATIILCLWAAAASLLSLPVTVASQNGRVMSVTNPIEIHANTDQPIATIGVKLGDKVKKGSLLVAFDDSELKLSLAAKQARLQNLTVQLSGLDQQLASSLVRLSNEQKAFDYDLERVNALVSQQEAALTYSTEAVKVYRQLRSERRIDELNYQKNLSQRAQDLMALKAMRAELSQLSAEKKLAHSVWQKENEELQSSRNAMSGEINELQPEIAALRQQIERMRVIANIDGSIGSLASIAQGQRMAVNDFLMTLIPERAFKFRGNFLAKEGAARLQPGQTADIEFTSLPWTEFGTLSAEVARVGTEERNGMIDVDLALSNKGRLASYVGYGLKGRAIVQIDQATLLQKLVRLLGRSNENSD